MKKIEIELPISIGDSLYMLQGIHKITEVKVTEIYIEGHLNEYNTHIPSINIIFKTSFSKNQKFSLSDLNKYLFTSKKSLVKYIEDQL